MNINNNTRVRVDRKIHEELNIRWWDVWELKNKFRIEYDMILTCRRNTLYYFKPNDEQKYMFFILNYGKYIKSKPKKLKESR